MANNEFETCKLEDNKSGDNNLALNLRDLFSGNSNVEPNTCRPGDTTTLVNQGSLPGVELYDSKTDVKADTMKGNPGSQLLEESGNRVSEIPSPNGKIITYDNGAARNEQNNGDVYEVRPNGMEIREKKDHTVSVTIGGDTREVKPGFPDQKINKTEVKDDGRVVYRYDNGTVETTYRGGGKNYEYKDGTSALYLGKDMISRTDKDGTEYQYDIDHKLEKVIKNYPDYNSVTSDANGRVLSTFSLHAEREYKYDDRGELNEVKGVLGTWKLDHDKDGKTMWVNQNTKDVWHGDFNVDKDGTLHYTAHDGQSYNFTRDGRDIPVPTPRKK